MSDQETKDHSQQPEQSDASEGQELNDNELEDVAGGVNWHWNRDSTWDGDAWQRSAVKQKDTGAGTPQ